MIGLIWLSSTYCYALTDGALFGGAGLLILNSQRTATEDTGSTSFMTTSFYPLQVRGYYQLFGSTYFSPRLAYTLLPREAEDGATDTRILQISLPFTETFGSTQSWDYSYGLGVQLYQQQGQGGTVTLGNAGGTSEFARPSTNSESQSWLVELGLGYQATPDWRVDLELWSQSLLSERRAFSWYLNFSYKISGLGGTP